jgi:hypothetical protein
MAILLWATRTLPLGTLAFCGLARADLINDFNISAAGCIDAFSFSFTVPSFVARVDARVHLVSPSPPARVRGQ